MTTALDPEVFERAAARIERDGFHKGDYFPGITSLDMDDSTLRMVGEYLRDSPVPCCALGALAAEAPNCAEEYGDVLGRAIYPGEVAVDTHERFNIYVPDWNDAEERTAEDVIAALKATAKSVREGSGNE